MLGLQAGDDSALDLLMIRHRAPLRRFIWRIVRDEAAADDLTQETFLRVYLARARYEPRCKFSTWLYTVASNLSLNWVRDRRSKEKESFDTVYEGRAPMQVADPKPSVEYLLADRDRRNHLHGRVGQAMRSLPHRQRMAIQMRFWRELPYHEVAANLGCSVQSVKSLLHRAHASLRVKLVDEDTRVYPDAA